MVYLALFIYPLWRHLRRSHYLLAGWLAYLALAGANPYIFSTNGMTVLAAVLLGAMVVPARKEPPWTCRDARETFWSPRASAGSKQPRVEQGSERTA
jgi:heme exporter protein D